MRRIDQNYYRDKVYQRARGTGNVQLNGDNNSIHINSILSHPPKDVEFRVIANLGVYIASLGIIIAGLFYVLTIKAAGYVIKSGYIDKEYWYVVIIVGILLVGIVTTMILLWTDDLSFKINTAHVKYKNKSIYFNGRERKFYDEIWDIQRGKGINSKVIYCYGVSPNVKRPVYRLRLLFLNEEEAKYLHDVFHAGKYIKK